MKLTGSPAVEEGMKKTALFVLVIAILLSLQGGDAGAADKRTLEGEFVWNQGGEGRLKAVFTAVGKEKWKVDFHFNFRNRSHTYSGTAEGSLNEGELKGKVKNESRQRTFTFAGEFEDGRFRGRHQETNSGRARQTGTLTLSARRPSSAAL